MRTIALLFLLVGGLIYLLPYYRQWLGVPIPIEGENVHNIAVVAMIAGFAALVWSLR